jgi:Aldolase/RraA
VSAANSLVAARGGRDGDGGYGIERRRDLVFQRSHTAGRPLSPDRRHLGGAQAVKATKGGGVVINGSIRDLEGIGDFKLPAYVRTITPNWFGGSTLYGYNVPVRMGNVVVDGALLEPPST